MEQDKTPGPVYQRQQEHRHHVIEKLDCCAKPVIQWVVQPVERHLPRDVPVTGNGAKPRAAHHVALPAQAHPVERGKPEQDQGRADTGGAINLAL